MSILSIASNASAWRGYEYYEGKRVLSWKQISEHEFEGEVAGSEKEPYHVILDTEDFIYLANRKGKPCDMEAYRKFLRLLVERMTCQVLNIRSNIRKYVMNLI